MTIQQPLNNDSTSNKSGGEPPSGYNEILHRRFMLWRDQSGASVNRIAMMIDKSAALVSQYINRKYQGDIAEIEKDIANLLRREEDFEHPLEEEAFCPTHNAKLIWEVLQFCDEYHEMGVAVGRSGSGKTRTCNEYKRKNRASILITADLTRRSISSVLMMIASKTGGTVRSGTNSLLLDSIIDRLKGSNRLIIIDEAHLLRWENFEVIRKIHDCGNVGIVYVGQERLYDQMKGDTDKAYLYDQIYGRITMKRDRFHVNRKDVVMIAESLKPGLNKECIDFLYKISQLRKGFRNMTKTLKVAKVRQVNYGVEFNLDLLTDVYGFLMKEE